MSYRLSLEDYRHIKIKQMKSQGRNKPQSTKKDEVNIINVVASSLALIKISLRVWRFLTMCL